MKTSPTCRCCGSAKTTFRGRKFGKFIKTEVDYFVCDDCEFLFVDPFPGYEIYNDAYYRGEGPDPYVDYESEYRDYGRTDRLIEFKDVAAVAERFLRRYSAGASIDWLDYGCGAGGFLKYLTDRRELRAGSRTTPVHVRGHDLGTYADRLRTDGFDLLNAEELAATPDGSYDIISLIEVLEHVHYPNEVIASAARLLKPGGLLILTTGNVASPVASRLGLNYGYLIPEIHVSLFTPRSLEKLYARNQLTPYQAHYKGVVRFKVIKTLRVPLYQQIARVTLRLPFVTKLIDWLYGVSAMPCARKANRPV